MPGTRERVERTRDEAMAEGVLLLAAAFRLTPGHAAFAEGVSVGIRAALTDPEHAELVMEALIRAYGGGPDGLRIIDGHADAVLVRARKTVEREQSGDLGE